MPVLFVQGRAGIRVHLFLKRFIVVVTIVLVRVGKAARVFIHQESVLLRIAPGVARRLRELSSGVAGYLKFRSPRVPALVFRR